MDSVIKQHTLVIFSLSKLENMVSRSNLKTFFNYATDYINFFKIKFTLALIPARKRLYKKGFNMVVYESGYEYCVRRIIREENIVQSCNRGDCLIHPDLGTSLFMITGININIAFASLFILPDFSGSNA